MLFQSVFEQWFADIKSFWTNLDYVLFWGWVLLVIGLLCMFLLIFFTEYKRKERDSMKFTAFILCLAAIAIGFGVHMILVASGLW